MAPETREGLVRRIGEDGVTYATAPIHGSLVSCRYTIGKLPNAATGTRMPASILQSGTRSYMALYVQSNSHFSET